MPTPSKSVTVLKTENKSHRTKAELDQRQKSEAALMTGIKLREKDAVKQNLISHKEFLRIQKLLGVIEKNDALVENTINRYCQIYAECIEFENKRERFYASLDELEDEHRDQIASGEITWLDYMKLRSSFQTQLINLDKQVQAKREMMLRIEKENLMTIAAALRAVPKKEQEEVDPHKGLFG